MISFKEQVSNELELEFLPPTDWKQLILDFIELNVKSRSLTLTGRDERRSIESVYSSLNTALRKARMAGNPLPVKVSRRYGKVHLYRTDM